MKDNSKGSSHGKAEQGEALEKGQRLAKLNMVLMIIGFLSWAGAPAQAA